MLSNIIMFFFIEVFKKTLENARPNRALKPGSKSGT